MTSVNQVFLLGRLGGDAETRRHGERLVSRCSLATDRRRKGADGEWTSETDWHLVAIWSTHRPGAPEGISQYLTKGSRIHVQGRLRPHSWIDQTTGGRRWRTEVVAQAMDVSLLGSPRSKGSAPSDDEGRAPGAPAQPPPAADPPPDDDDIPF